MGASYCSLLVFGLMTVLSTFNLSCALPSRDVKTLEDSTRSLAVTPSPDLPQWIVKDDNNKICMLMAMNATIELYDGTSIPPSATATQKSGRCDSNSAAFALRWTSGGSIYTMLIQFEVTGHSYRLVEINGTITQDFNFDSWSSKSSSFPSASIGNYMTCENFNAGDIHFAKYQFQPFAQQSAEQYGKAEACSSGVLESWWFYVLSGIICFVVVSVIVECVLIRVKRKQGNRGYTQLK